MARRPKRRILFFDRSTGSGLPDALRHLDIPTKYGDRLFAPDAIDDDWLPDIGKRGWVLCTQDYSHHKSKNMNEALAIRQYGIRCFYVWGSEAPKVEMMRAFLRGYAKMLEIIETVEPPYIYRLDRRGRITEVPLP